MRIDKRVLRSGCALLALAAAFLGSPAAAQGVQPDQPPHRLDHPDRLALHQQLPTQQRPVELPLGEPHGPIMPGTTDSPSRRRPTLP